MRGSTSVAPSPARQRRETPERTRPCAQPTDPVPQGEGEPGRKDSGRVGEGAARRSPRLRTAGGSGTHLGVTAGQVADMSPGSMKRLLFSMLSSSRETGGGSGSVGPTGAERSSASKRACSPIHEGGGAVRTRLDDAAIGDSVAAALSLCGEGGTASAVAHLAIPAQEAELVGLSTLAAKFEGCGLPDVVKQFAHAAGDNMPTTMATAMEGRMLLKNIELAHADMVAHDPRMGMAHTPRARSWSEGAQLLMRILTESSSLFRTRRGAGLLLRGGADAGGDVGGVSAGGAAPREAATERPPSGSFKTVAVAPEKHKAGACRTELLEGMASVEALRREHLRKSSAFKDVSLSSVEQRDEQLAGELTYFHSSYGQGAIAYIMSNGMCTTTLSGSGVPMALHNIRTHLLARARCVIDGALGEAKASALGPKVEALEIGFLTGIPSDMAEDCVIFLGGSAPDEEAEIEEEGASISAGTLGKISGEGAAAAIRDAFSTWAEGMGRTLGAMPGVDAGPRVDFGMPAMLRRIKGRVNEDTLLSVCRYVLDKTYAGLLKHRMVPGRILPDLTQVVATAGGKVFTERRTDERLARRAREEFERCQKEGGAKPAGRSMARTKGPPHSRGGEEGGSTTRVTHHQKGGRGGDYKRQRLSDAAAAPPTATASASKLADELLASMRTPEGRAAAPSPVPKAKFAPSAVIRNRTQAIIELSALWREAQGWQPGHTDPTKEPCAAKALLGECTHEKCVRCASGAVVPNGLLKDVLSRCADGWRDKTKHTGKDKRSK